MAMDEAARAASWAATLYAAADNDLSAYALRDLDDIGRAGKPVPGMFLGFELDCQGPQGSLRYEFLPAPTGERRRLRAVVERLPEQDTGDPATLRNHLDWAARRAGDGRRWLVIVWGHGMGRTVAPDQHSFGGALDIAALREAFHQAGFGAAAAARAEAEGLWAGATRGQIAILGFDACLMGTIENAAALHDVADILIASQELVPARGWPYARILDPERHVEEAAARPWPVARHIVDAYAAFHAARGQTDVLMSAVATAFARDRLGEAGRLGRGLAEALAGSEGAAVRSAVCTARDLAQPFWMIDYVDLADLAARLAASLGGQGCGGAVAAAAQALADRLAAAGPDELHCGKPALRRGGISPVIRDACGLSIWFPTQRELFYSHRAAYAASLAHLADADAREGWLAFLTALHRAPRGRG